MNDMNSGMVANLEWVNTAPDSENNYTMACPFPLEGEPSGAGDAAVPAVPMAVLICRHNSHPFQKRTLLLNQPVKVGRSVAKTKADVNNAIFDCKVLSRHHASLWYEKGSFYLADTKSSNGTFVNSHRLSEGSKESAPYEVCSGDIVQFGVDVMENSGSVTHGCIVATLKLYLPDGKEAKASSNMSIQSMPLDDLHILNKIIQEAFDREYMLEEKLSSLRQAVDSCQNAADASWRAQVCEDHLLCRVHFLEKRLATTSGNVPPTEIQQLLEDKHKYEVSAKESLRLSHEERLKLMNQVCSLQWSLCSTADECAALRNSTERAHEDYQKLNSKYSTLELQLKTAQKALENAEHRLNEEKIRIKDLLAEHDRQVTQLKLENEKHTVVDCGIDELIDSEKNDLIIDNKTWEKGDYKESSLPEAIRGLPDYLKAILPDQILQKVGCKSLRTSSQVNELKSKLLYLNKELCNLEKNRTADEANENSNEHNESEDPEKSISDTTLEMKSVPLNSSTCNDIHLENSNTKQSNDDECDETLNTVTEEKELENHKEVYENSNNLEKPEKESSKNNDMRLCLIDEIKKISEQLEEAREEGPIEKITFLQDELSNSLSKISSLRNELKTLQTSLSHSHNKIIELKQDKEQVLSDKKALEIDITEKSELCRSLELQIAHWKEKEKIDEASSTKYKEIAADLQSKLSRALESEANCCKELKESNIRLFELQKQLDSRPQLADVENLRLKIEKLESELESKEDHIKELLDSVETLKEANIILEEKISAFNSSPTECCNCKNIISESADTPSESEESDLSPNQQSIGHILISSSMSAENLMLNHNQDLLSKDASPFSSVSVNLKRLSELEEELVVTKEKWAHVSEERSQLASELESMTEKNKQLVRRSILNALVFVVPLLAIFLYIITKHQSIS